MLGSGEARDMYKDFKLKNMKNQKARIEYKLNKFCGPSSSIFSNDCFWLWFWFSTRLCEACICPVKLTRWENRRDLKKTNLLVDRPASSQQFLFGFLWLLYDLIWRGTNDLRFQETSKQPSSVKAIARKQLFTSKDMQTFNPTLETSWN